MATFRNIIHIISAKIKLNGHDTHSSSKTFMIIAHEIFAARSFEKFDDLLSFYSGEMIQKHLEIISPPNNQ